MADPPISTSNLLFDRDDIDVLLRILEEHSRNEIINNPTADSTSIQSHQNQHMQEQQMQQLQYQQSEPQHVVTSQQEKIIQEQQYQQVLNEQLRLQKHWRQIKEQQHTVSYTTNQTSEEKVEHAVIDHQQNLVQLQHQQKQQQQFQQLLQLQQEWQQPPQQQVNQHLQQQYWQGPLSQQQIKQPQQVEQQWQEQPQQQFQRQEHVQQNGPNMVNHNNERKVQHVVTDQQQNLVQLQHKQKQQQQFQQLRQLVQEKRQPLQQQVQQQCQRQIQHQLKRQKIMQQTIPPTIKQKEEKKVYLEIVEQVSNEKMRFRYISESRSVFITGINSTPEHKTFPTVRVMGDYIGKCRVEVSCVTEDYPYKAHPHELIDKYNEFSFTGAYTKDVDEETMTADFEIGIQCVTLLKVKSSLEKREKAGIDPFKQGFEHKNDPKKINLGAIRLCFQGLIPLKHELWVRTDPIVSNPVYDSRTHGDLQICKISHYTGTCLGGTEMIILCEKVVKNDILVIFYEEMNGKVIWEAKAIFFQNHVHRQVAIYLKTPPYKTQVINRPVPVFIQLKRPSDGELSDPRPFQYLPPETGESNMLKRKRKKFGNDTEAYLMERLNTKVNKTYAEPKKSFFYKQNIFRYH